MQCYTRLLISEARSFRASSTRKHFLFSLIDAPAVPSLLPSLLPSFLHSEFLSFPFSISADSAILPHRYTSRETEAWNFHAVPKNTRLAEENEDAIRRIKNVSATMTECETRPGFLCLCIGILIVANCCCELPNLYTDISRLSQFYTCVCQ